MADGDNVAPFQWSNIVISLDTDGVLTITPGSVEKLFFGLPNLTAISELANLQTATGINIDSLFAHCPNLTSLELSNFDTTKVKTMANMLYDYQKLTTLNLSAKFVTLNVNDMSSMFTGGSALET